MKGNKGWKSTKQGCLKVWNDLNQKHVDLGSWNFDIIFIYWDTHALALPSQYFKCSVTIINILGGARVVLKQCCFQVIANKLLGTNASFHSFWYLQRTVNCFWFLIQWLDISKSTIENQQKWFLTNVFQGLT